MFDRAKYIIFADEVGGDTVIIFPITLQHGDVARMLRMDTVSAGFVYFTRTGVEAFGESLSLGKKSREEDSALIAKQLGTTNGKVTELAKGARLESDAG